MADSSTAKDAELAAAEVAAILAAAPTAAAPQPAQQKPREEPEHGELQDDEDDDADGDADDVVMQGTDANATGLDAVAAAAAASASSAPMAITNSGAGAGDRRSSSPLSDGSMSNLSELTPPSASSRSLSDDEEAHSPRPATAGQGPEDEDRLSDDDSGSSDISEPADEDTRRRPNGRAATSGSRSTANGGGRSRRGGDDSDASDGGSDLGDSASELDGNENEEEDDEEAAEDIVPPTAMAAAAVAAAAAATVPGAASDTGIGLIPPTSATVLSDDSDLGSPESIAETEPLPFEDTAQTPGGGGGADGGTNAAGSGRRTGDDKDEDEDDDGDRHAQERATPVHAEAAKDDANEIITATPQEAMEALTRIEIQFAMLRDRLYVERMEEVCRETEMILEGTHPELIRFTRAIDELRERRLRLLDLELENQVHHYEQVAEGEEQITWNSYRYQAAELRQNMMDDTARKRRRLEREKRLIDVPRPARRHQTFETELIPNPERQYAAALRARRREIAVGEATAAVAAVSARDPEQARRAAVVVQQLQEVAAEDDANDYVAYPEVKGLDEGELWSDLDRMGILPYNSGTTLQHYYSPEEMQGPMAGPSSAPADGALTGIGLDPYAAYAPGAGAGPMGPPVAPGPGPAPVAVGPAIGPGGGGGAQALHPDEAAFMAATSYPRSRQQQQQQQQLHLRAQQQQQHPQAASASTAYAPPLPMGAAAGPSSGVMDHHGHHAQSMLVPEGVPGAHKHGEGSGGVEWADPSHSSAAAATNNRASMSITSRAPQTTTAGGGATTAAAGPPEKSKSRSSRKQQQQQQQRSSSPPNKGVPPLIYSGGGSTTNNSLEPPAYHASAAFQTNVATYMEDGWR